MSTKILDIHPLGFPWKTEDPFLFCVYHHDKFPAGNGKLGVDPEHLAGRSIGQDFTIKDGWRMYHGSTMPGFPYHPHRGFETITIVKKGFVDHSDSLGASGRFSSGDVQWMTAGKGVQHSEMFPLINTDKGNTLELFQIWLNLPARSKMVEPHFKMLWKENIPVVTIEDNNGRKTIIDLVAGSIGDKKALDPTPDSWAADPSNEVGVMTVKMEPGAEWTIHGGASGLKRSIHFYNGSTIQVEGQDVRSDHSAELDGSQDVTIVNGDEDAYILLLQGMPINEPVVQHGPFVMNSQQEIQQAFNDYQQTQFGGWPWPEREQNHGLETGRFAQHADGRKETP